MSPRESVTTPARVATALATAASIWCLEAAQLLSARAAFVAVALLLIAESYAAGWPGPARRIAFPIGLVLYGGIAVERLREVTLTSVSSARPLGAFLTAGSMVVLALAGRQRRDVLARVGLLVAGVGLALTAASKAALIPAIAVGLAAGAALLALERSLLTSASTAAQSRQPPPALARTRLIAVPLAATVVLTAYVANSASLPQHHSQGSIGNSAGLPESFNGNASGGTRLDPTSEEMDLRTRGALSKQPVAQITSLDGNESPHLWRAALMDGYDGHSWYLADEPDPVAASGGQLIDEVNPLNSSELPLLSPGTPTRLIAGGTADDDPSFPQTVDGRYQVTSVVPDATDAQIDEAPKAVTAQDEENVTAPSVPARVIALGQQITANATTRREAVAAVVSYLHSHETYKLNSPVPAKGEDAVDDFLFRSHTGFCEQFASAAAILLQASGVPTRVVTGYASGEQQSDGSWLLRGSDAHAWIEVEYPGVGWLPVDPTAGVRLAPSGSGSHWQRLAIGAALLLFLGLVGAGIVAARRRRELRADPLRHSLAMLDAALGSARRQPTESLRDLAGRVPLSPVERGALSTAEREFYGPRSQGTAEIHHAAATMRRTARRLRKERVLPRRRSPRH